MKDPLDSIFRSLDYKPKTREWFRHRARKNKNRGRKSFIMQSAVDIRPVVDDNIPPPWD